MIRKPNLFVIGAMKAGTSTLHAMLAQHPEICMSRVKEPGYFIVPEGAHPKPQFRTRYAGNREAYLSLFTAAALAKYAGESSPDYTRLPAIRGVPERIRKFDRNAALIYIVRDPVERSISHYWWNVQHHGERRSMYEAIRGDAQYEDVSNYAMQLRPFLDRFGAGRVHVLTLERLNADPDHTLAGLFDWLGVAPSPVEVVRENATPRVIEAPAGGGWLHRLRFSKTWSCAGRFVPMRLRLLAKRAAYNTVERADARTEQVIERLRAVQVEQVEELSRLVGREFPEWRTLAGGVGRGGEANSPGARNEPGRWGGVEVP